MTHNGYWYQTNDKANGRNAQHIVERLQLYVIAAQADGGKADKRIAPERIEKGEEYK